MLRPAAPPADLIAQITDPSEVSHTGFRIPHGSVFEWRLPGNAIGTVRFSWKMLEQATGTLTLELMEASTPPRIVPFTQTGGGQTISYQEIKLDRGTAASLRFSSRDGHVLLSDLRLVRPSEENAALIFVLIDTLRRDAVGLYGSPRPTTPRIDRFFSTAWRAERAYAPASWTTPSVAALFTGHPVHLLGDDPGDPIGDHRTLATTFRRAGWSTAAVIANPTLNRTNGFDAGFTAFYTSPYDAASMRIPANVTTARIGPWLRASRSFFMST